MPRLSRPVSPSSVLHGCLTHKMLKDEKCWKTELCMSLATLPFTFYRLPFCLKLSFSANEDICDLYSSSLHTPFAVSCYVLPVYVLFPCLISFSLELACISWVFDGGLTLVVVNSAFTFCTLPLACCISRLVYYIKWIPIFSI